MDLLNDMKYWSLVNAKKASNHEMSRVHKPKIFMIGKSDVEREELGKQKSKEHIIMCFA